MLLCSATTVWGQGIDIDKQLAERKTEEVYDDSDIDRHGGNLRSIYLSPRVGDAQNASLDTLRLNYFHRAFVEGRSIAEVYTGTYASPYQSMVYFDRPINRWGDFFFTAPYTHLYRNKRRMQWYDTKVPYTFLSYRTIGLGQDREQNLSLTFSSNLGKEWNVGGDFDLDYAEGIYANTASKNITYRVFASYNGSRYQAYASVGNTNVMNQESGGITDMRHITHPDEFSDGRRALLPKDIPTKYRSTWNRVVYGSGRLHHKYSLGFYKDKEGEKIEKNIENIVSEPSDSLSLVHNDSINVEEPKAVVDSLSLANTPNPTRRVRSGKSSGQAEKETEDSDEASDAEAETKPKETRLFVPVTSIFHDLEVQQADRFFVSRDPIWEKLYPNPILPRLQGVQLYPYDQIRAVSVSNALGIELLEGFHKWAKMGLAAFVAFDFTYFEQPLVRHEDAYRLDIEEEKLTKKEGTTYVGGRASSNSFKYFGYNVWGQVGVAGAKAGEVEVRGELTTYFPLFKKDVLLKGSFELLNTPPSYFLQRYKASLIEWEQSYRMIQAMRVGGELAVPALGTKVKVNFETLQNPIFVNAEAKPEQMLANTRVLAVQMEQKLSWKALNWENQLVWQNSSNHSVAPLPDLAVYSNFYLKTLIAKVMTLQLGVDAKWHTKYTPPYYEPITQAFRPQTDIELGGEAPLLSVYANVHLKRARFFVVYHNVGATFLRPSQFTMPYYPTYPPSLRLGIAVDLRN